MILINSAALRKWADKNCMGTYWLPILIVFISSCASPVGIIDGKKDLDETIRIVTQKLIKYPDNNKYAAILVAAYQEASLQSDAKIKALDSESDSGHWEKILDEYLAIDKRQELVKTVSPLTIDGKMYSLPINDVTTTINKIKAKIAENHYVRAKQLIAGNTKKSYQEAHAEFEKTRQYSFEYPDIDTLDKEAIEKGTYHVWLAMESNSDFKLSDRSLRKLLEPADLNSPWIKYHNQIKDNQNYDYNINIELLEINITPDKVTTVEHVETKTISVGCSNKFDLISCTVGEKFQEKAIHIGGNILFIQNSCKRIVKSIPFTTDYVFKFSSYAAEGDKSLLSARWLELIKNYPKPLPYPSNFEMVDSVVKNLNSTITNIILANQVLLND